MEKKKLKLEEVSVQSFITQLEEDKKRTVDGAVQGLSLECLTGGTILIVRCCAISAAQPEACLASVAVSALSIAWESAINECGSVKICFKPPANASAACRTEKLPCTGGRMICD